VGCRSGVGERVAGSVSRQLRLPVRVLPDRWVGAAGQAGELITWAVRYLGRVGPEETGSSDGIHTIDSCLSR
jgi:hypothetical protein